MTTLEFAYDFDKDVENFLRGTRSVNSAKPTKLQRAYIDKNGPDYNEELVRWFIREYIQESGFDAEAAVRAIEGKWRPIEDDFFRRIEEIFGISYPASKITVYITTNGRCTYRIEDGYFFVYANTNYPNMTIMHELLHFYTWEAFHTELEGKGVTPEQYNAVKESLTELLNSEFADLMGEAHDDGYTQHAEMRKEVAQRWSETKDMRRTVFGALSL